MAATKQPLLETATQEKMDFSKVCICSQTHFGIHPTKVIDNCNHGNPNLEIDLKLRGEPVEGSSLNVKKVSGRLRIQILLSLFFFGVEFITGIISGSIALIADSYHMAADVMALIVAFICLRMADKQSKSNSYGWVRAEALGGFFNGLFLLTVCLSIFQEASGRLLHPKTISQPLHVLAVGIIGLLINVIGLFLLNGQGHGHSHGGGGHGHSHGGGRSSAGHGHSHGGGHGHSHGHKSTKKSKCGNGLLKDEETEMNEIEDSKPRTNTTFSLERRFTGPTMPYATRMASELLEPELSEDNSSEGSVEPAAKKKASKNVNIHGVYLHLMSDAFGSVIVIFAASCVYFWPEWSWSAYFDPALSLILATMMSFSAMGLVRDSVNILLMKAPNGFVNKEVMADLRKIVGVADVTNVNIWSLTGSRLLASAKVNFCHPAIFADAVFKIRKYFHDAGIHSTTIEPTFEPDCMESMRVTVEECTEEHHHHDHPEEKTIVKQKNEQEKEEEDENENENTLNYTHIIETTIDFSMNEPSGTDTISSSQ